MTPTTDPQALPDDFISAEYTYDGDDNMVKSVIDGVTTYYVGGYYELRVEDSVETEVKYYMAAGRRIAMRTITSSTDILYWLISDHLSSTTIITDESGTIISEMKYTAFGEIREMNGNSPTDYLYTGQRKEVEFGLSYYVARWYDSTTGHFTSADTLIPQPGNAGDWDRYAYVLNNPLKYIDPSGHWYSGPEMKDYFEQTQYGGNYKDIKDPYEEPVKTVVGTTENLDDRKIKSQNEKIVIDKYGSNACPLYAVAAGDMHVMDGLYNIDPTAYDPDAGMQPEVLEKITKEYCSINGCRVTVTQNNHIEDLADGLLRGARVVVDIKVGIYSQPGNHSAHFAEVLKVDFTTSTISIYNSLKRVNKKAPYYVEMTFDQFYDIWYDPENDLANPDLSGTKVIYWALYFWDK